MMFKLYEINREVEKALEKYMDENGEISEEGAQALDELDLNKEVKVLNTAKLIKSLELEAEMIKKAEQDLTKRRKSLENKAKRLKDYITYYAPGEEFKDEQIKVSWRKSFALPEYDPQEVPDQFKIIEQVTKVDGRALTEAIKNKTFLGFSLVERNNIQIK